jgi:hypothetical protein
MPKSATRKYAEQREMTWGYATGVDGINTARRLEEIWFSPIFTAASIFAAADVEPDRYHLWATSFRIST